MRLIQYLSPLLLATFDILMKLLRVLETVFMVNPKGASEKDDACRYHIFRDMPFVDYFCSAWVVINLWPFGKGF